MLFVVYHAVCVLFVLYTCCLCYIPAVCVCQVQLLPGESARPSGHSVTHTLHRGARHHHLQGRPDAAPRLQDDASLLQLARHCACARPLPGNAATNYHAMIKLEFYLVILVYISLSSVLTLLLHVSVVPLVDIPHQDFGLS